MRDGARDAAARFAPGEMLTIPAAGLALDRANGWGEPICA